MSRNKSDVVREAACGHWLFILSSLSPLLGPACDKMPHPVPCPKRTDSKAKNGFRLFKDANQTGGGISNTDGAFPNGFNLLMWVNGWSFSETLNQVCSLLEIGDWKKIERIAPRTTAALVPAPINPQKLLERRLKLRKVWSQSFPIGAKQALLGRKYLYSRSIFLKQDEYERIGHKMRFHPCLEYWHDNKLIGKYPAIVSLVSYENGEPASLHRTYLDEHGLKLNLVVDGESLPSKKLMARCAERRLSGGAIRLKDPVSNSLDLSEGIETGLAVCSVINKPVWPCVSTTLLGNFNPPNGIDTLNVWADLDRNKAGFVAAKKLQERMQDIGVTVNILLPNEEIPINEKGVDWNDVLATKGKSHFPAVFAH